MIAAAIQSLAPALPLGTFFISGPPVAHPPAVLDPAATVFVLVCASLVLLMTFGLALFYGGLTRATAVVNMLMMSLGALGVVGVLYILYGYAMSFGNLASGRGDLLGIIADPRPGFGLAEVTGAAGASADGPVGNSGLPLVDVLGTGAWIPEVLFAGFQLTFACLAVALISGAVADRVRLATWLMFSGIWVSVVYFPLAHMVWGGGLLSGGSASVAGLLFGSTDGVANVPPIDFAGGTVVHINAGVAALVLAVVVGQRFGFGTQIMRPHNVPLVMVGVGLLWFGWFGFNAGSELAADGTAALVWINTVAATCAAVLGWLLVEQLRDGRVTSIGAASGVVAGLVAITPACAALSPVGALALGAGAGAVCAVAVHLKFRFGLDDSLDVVGLHLVAGIVGTVGVGLLATGSGLFYGHGPRQLVVQVVVALATLAWSGGLTLAIGLALSKAMGWRIAAEDEISGIDLALHAESGYDLAVGGHRPWAEPAGASAVGVPGSG